MREWTSGAIAACALLAAMPAAARAQAGGTDAGGGHGEPLVWSFQVERLEHRWNDGADTVNWEADAFVGSDEHKLLLKTEGEKPVDGAVESAELQVLYSRMVSDFWDLQAGVRHDVRPEPQTSYAVLGVEGLTPYFIETEAHGFLSEDGDVTARAEAEFDLLITQQWVLQPSAELTAAMQDVEELGIGAGLSSLEVGLRLRYEFTREFAPYVGVAWEKKLGETADLARREQEDTDTVSVLAGVKFWF